jgi:hypothetical protein
LTETEDNADGLIVRAEVIETAPVVALIVAVVTAPTAEVATVNVAVVPPAATTTVDGTEAFVVLEANVTDNPPVGAGPLIVTDPVADDPPMTVVGLNVNPVRTGGLIIRVAETVVPPSVAEIEAEVAVATAVVVMEKVTLVEPLGTTTVAGTTALELPEVKLTVMPPVGAGPLNVSVPDAVLPPVTEVGETVRPAGNGAVIVSVALALIPPSAAEIVALVVEATADVLILKVAVV